MAPRRKSIGSTKNTLNTISDKENSYLRSLSDYQARVRRRESIRSCKNVAEYDLEQKIEVEAKIKEGSCKLLAAARHPAQSLEAARALLTSSKKMSAYKAELQSRTNDASLNASHLKSRGELSISDLRFPLMWRDSDHFKNRGDHRRFAIFCIARVGAQVQDTCLIYPVDREQTDITFPDVLVFNDVPPEFELTLELYSHMLREDLSIASTPRRIRRTIHSSISKTVGKKFVAALKEEYGTRKSASFDLVAYSTMRLDDTDTCIRSYDLTLNDVNNKAHALPLFDHFCCHLAVQPSYMDGETCLSFATVNNVQCWMRLQGSQIQTWVSKESSEKLESPLDLICVTKGSAVSRSKTGRNQLQVINEIDGNERCDVLKFKTNEEAQKWYEQLTMRINEYKRWKHAALSLQRNPRSDTDNGNTCAERGSPYKGKRSRSLYDETHCTEGESSGTISTLIRKREPLEFLSLQNSALKASTPQFYR